MKLIKIITLLGLFLFTTGFVPVISFIGPGFTVLSSGNIYKAAAQFFIDQSVKKETGKSTLKRYQNFKKTGSFPVFLWLKITLQNCAFSSLVNVLYRHRQVH